MANLKPKLTERGYLLKLRQNMPLDMKVKFTINRIKWITQRTTKTPVISFSGGADSLALLHIARKYIDPNFPAVFSNTSMEFPEIVKFVKSFKGIEIVKPKKTYKEILDKYGYPVVSKNTAMAISRFRNTKREDQRDYRLHGRWVKGKKHSAGTIAPEWRFLIDAPFKISDECCTYLKKNPLKDYSKKKYLVPIIATMASDSQPRKQRYLQVGCNVYLEGKEQSNPMSFWHNSDSWEYIKSENITYCEIYDYGYEHTGCYSCGFGCHKEKGCQNRYQILHRTHPTIWDRQIHKYGWGNVLKYIGIPFEKTNEVRKVQPNLI